MHALHTVHAVPDLRHRAGRFVGRFLIEFSIVFVIPVTPRDESPKRINGNCLKLKAESCRRITLGELPAMTVQVGAGVLELVCPLPFSPNTLYLAVES